MLPKKIIEIIIFLNIAGFGFLLYIVGIILKDKFFQKRKDIEVRQAPVKTEKKPSIVNDNIIQDEDDLLKDMDLSDLEDLDFKDFD
ncbi:hypothetical protein [Desulfobacula toluolica]|uniref:Uncharacterized protein n=1 Tax=Desulfobacula toluolica (strain DSM 7467 / Tol2) TaxID=651182 RepID=K0NGD8_DESTT|nr:hypothetical protein [Desulfobacula toluolica]CCK80276.1 uncharacterized protein TOL2_C21150 [Desulfobacula toluolica Tol2]